MLGGHVAGSSKEPTRTNKRASPAPPQVLHKATLHDGHRKIVCPLTLSVGTSNPSAFPDKTLILDVSIIAFRECAEPLWRWQSYNGRHGQKVGSPTYQTGLHHNYIDPSCLTSRLDYPKQSFSVFPTVRGRKDVGNYYPITIARCGKLSS